MSTRMANLPNRDGAEPSASGNMTYAGRVADGDAAAEQQQAEEGGEEFWTQLPVDLVLNIMKRMPLQSFFRLRSVCKAWGQFFRELDYPLALGQPPMFMLVEKNTCNTIAAYDPAFRQWKTVPVSWISSASSDRHGEQLSPLAAGGGLVVLKHLGMSYRYDLVVSNPLTKSRTFLPTLHKSSRHVFVLGIFVDQRTGNYKIPVLDLTRKSYGDLGRISATSLHEFDSETGCWRLTELGAKAIRTLSATYFNETLYFLVPGMKDLFEVYYVLDGFAHLLEAKMPDRLDYAHLHHHRGRLLMVGCIVPDDFSILRVDALHIWELDWDKMNWVELYSAPQALAADLGKLPPGYSNCFFLTVEIVCDGDYIFVLSCNGEMAMFNMSTELWSRLPRCPVGALEKTVLYPSEGRRLLLDPRLDLQVKNVNPVLQEEGDCLPIR